MNRTRERAGLFPPCPVVIRGKQYPSIRAAAKDVGVNSKAVCVALDRHGHADFVGLGNRKGIRKGNTNSTRKPVKVGPHEFESRTALARALGWDRYRVYYALRAGASGRVKDQLVAAVMAYGMRAAA